MKFVVDSFPKREEECPFAEWQPLYPPEVKRDGYYFPPGIKKDGYYTCRCDNQSCLLTIGSCKWLTQKR